MKLKQIKPIWIVQIIGIVAANFFVAWFISKSDTDGDGGTDSGGAHILVWPVAIMTSITLVLFADYIWKHLQAGTPLSFKRVAKYLIFLAILGAVLFFLLVDAQS